MPDDPAPSEQSEATDVREATGFDAPVSAAGPPPTGELPATRPDARDGFPGLAPTRRLGRRNRRRILRKGPAPGSNAIRLWTRRILAWTGLVIFAGCLFTLLNGGSLPEWHFGGNADSRLAGGTVAVVIDPGHGGWDTGAVAQGVREKDLNLDVGLRVSKVLEAHGVRTKLTRDDDHFVPLSGRVKIGNALPGAVFVSIHFNDAPPEGRAASRANGIETFYSEFKETPVAGAWTLTSLLGGKRGAAATPVDPAQSIRDGRDLADSIQSSLITGTAAIDRGIKERGLYVTRRVQGPAVLVEGGFVSHPAEARLLGDAGYRQKLAESIAGGIMKYLTGTRHQADGTPLAVVRKGVE